MKLLPNNCDVGYSVGCGYGYGNAIGDGYGFPIHCGGFCTGEGLPKGNGWGYYPVGVALYETKWFSSNP